MNAASMSSGALLEEDLALRPETDTRPTTHPDMRSSQRASNPTEHKAARIAQTLVLAFLFAVPALLCLHTAYVADPDLGWHIATAEWIAQHRAIPHADPFSRPVAGQPWQAYSWLFELLVAALYHRLGLAGILLYTSAMVLATTTALFHLVKRLQSDFSIAVLITFAAAFSMGRLYTPRPWHFTILLFLLELNILTRVRTAHQSNSRAARQLLWLPVIFALWANLHIQFIDGLALVALAVAESLIVNRRSTRTLWLAATLAASLLAACANPYGPHIYRTAYDLATQPGVLDSISELGAIPFRTLPDFTLLLLAFAAAAALAAGTVLRRTRLPLFQTALLVLAAFLAFRSLRDMWIMAIAAASVLAGSIVTRNNDSQRIPAFATPVAAALAGLAVLIGFQGWHLNNTRLADFQAQGLPVKAVQFIQHNNYSGPLFNDYGWGGYLIWSLHQPVSLDGRASLYGTARLDRSRDTWNGQPNWNTNPDLTSAGIVIGPIKAPLTQLLRLDPRYRLAYEDQLAAVFIPRKY